MEKIFGPGASRLRVDGRPVAPVHVATGWNERRRGLLGTDRLEGALWLQPCSSVHCIGMRYAIDVALLDRRGTVRRVRTLAPGRLTVPSPRVRAIVEAPAGAMREWGITAGQTLSATPA